MTDLEEQVLELCRHRRTISIPQIQIALRIGYMQAYRLLNFLESKGITRNFNKQTKEYTINKDALAHYEKTSCPSV